MALKDAVQPTEEVIRKNRQWPQWIAVFSASFNFMSAGICMCWSSPSLAILQSENSPFPVSNDEASWITSFLPIGCAVGPVLGAYLSRYLGPKQATLISAFPFLAGFVLIIFATGPNWLYLSRFLSGIGVGFGQTATPIYVSEIAENHNRGALMSFFSLMMAAGALLISCVGPYVTIIRMAEISSIFPCILLATLTFMPDSPYYLMRIGKEKKGMKSLSWLRRQKNDVVLEDEMKVIRKVVSDNLSIKKCIISLKDRPNPRALLIINVTFIAQQVCGAIVVLFYQEQIYQQANVPFSPAVAVIISSLVGNISGLISVIFVDRWGRKPLLLLSAFGCALSTGLLGTYLFFDDRHMLAGIPNINWTPVIALNGLQIFFSFGLSPIPYTQLGEMFNSNVKELAFCGLSVIAALEGFVITKSFQIIKDAYGLPMVFFLLSAMTMLTLVAMFLVIPETKGKSFLEIQELLSAPRSLPSNDIKLKEIKENKQIKQVTRF